MCRTDPYREVGAEMNKHTPGKWEVRFSEEDGKPYVATGLFILAQPIWSSVAAAVDDVAGRKRSKLEREANAYLMAAAPELLYALKELLYHTELRGDANKLLAVAGAEAAIAKAEAGSEG
jgi:hypothetical protein